MLHLTGNGLDSLPADPAFHENPWHEKRLPANLAGPVTLSSE